MNIKTKILAAFAVGTIGGTILGLLLKSEAAQSALAEGTKSEGESFLHKFFRGKKRTEINDKVKENAQEYED
jgi:hypothetical protein